MRRRISALRLDGPFVALQLCCMLKLLSKFSSCWKIGALRACLFSSPLLADPSRALMVETGAGAMVRTVIGLLTVVVLIFVCAWIVRRLGLRPDLRRTGLIKWIGAMALTQRERVVIVEVRNTWLVLGVAQGSVRLLHQFPAAPEHKKDRKSTRL